MHFPVRRHSSLLCLPPPWEPGPITLSHTCSELRHHAPRNSAHGLDSEPSGLLRYLLLEGSSTPMATTRALLWTQGALSLVGSAETGPASWSQLSIFSFAQEDRGEGLTHVIRLPLIVAPVRTYSEASTRFLSPLSHIWAPNLILSLP